MILGQQQANKILPLVNNLEAYNAFQELIKILHESAYNGLKFDIVYPPKDQFIGKLILLDELKTLKEQIKDSLRDK